MRDNIYNMHKKNNYFDFWESESGNTIWIAKANKIKPPEHLELTQDTPVVALQNNPQR